MISKKIGKVYLVGAGPGDIGLITVKGIECIKKADVIIYDRLVNIGLLDYKKEDCEIIYVGKKSSNHIMPQEKINLIIAEKAKEGKIVVRLKGGDPFVFGRGGEEAEVLFDEGIDFEIVPGVTSAIGGLCYAGIPVTHRDFASSFHVVTGHAKKDDSLEINWKALSEEKGTVIFLMGIGNIAHITDMLIKNGRREDTPVAFVSWATRYNQKTVVSTLKDAESIVKTGQIKAPALFVVGGVVSLTDKLGFFERKELFGKTIAVTRTRNKNSELRRKIEEKGGRVIEIPTLKIQEIENSENVLLEKLKEGCYNYLAFTSHNAVDYFFRILKRNKMDIRVLGGKKIASIGKVTSEALEGYGLIPDIIADKFTGEGLADKIVEDVYKNSDFQENTVENKRVLFPCSEIATEVFEEKLSKNGIKVERVAIYLNKPNLDIKEKIIEVFEKEKIDYITYTSSSTFNYFLQLIGEDRKDILQRTKKVSIGEITSKTIKDAGFSVEVQSKIPTIDSMVEAIEEDIVSN